MTVTSLVNSVTYSGDGTTTVFTVPFYFLLDTDLEVYLRTATTETQLARVVNYSVTGAGNASGGTLTLRSALQAGTTLVILRTPPATQLTDYAENDPFPAETHERALDKLTMLLQRHSSRLDRAIRLSDADSSANMVLPLAALRANRALAFDSGGNVTTAAIEGVIGDGGEGGSTANSFPISPAEIAAGLSEDELSLGYLWGDVRRYGGIEGGVSNLTPALQKAVNQGNLGGESVVIPPGDWLLSTGVTGISCSIYGYGATLTCAQQTEALWVGSNARIFGLTLIGPSGVESDGPGFGIYGEGVENGDDVEPTWVQNVLLQDLTIRQFGQCGIEFDYSSDIVVRNCRVQDVGYSAVFGYSVRRMRVFDCDLDTVNGKRYELANPGDYEVNCYGVTFTSKVNATNFTRNPRSADCSVTYCRIYSVPEWHALDTHGGIRIRFENNTIYNCRRGVILTNIGTAGAEDCIVDGNEIVNDFAFEDENELSNPPTRKRGEAIWDIGPSSSIRNKRNQITNNYIRKHGTEDSSLGAVVLQNTEGGTFEGNTLDECWSYGLSLLSYTRNYQIKGNTFVDVRGKSIANGGVTDYPTGIQLVRYLFEGNYYSNVNNVNIHHNSFVLRDPSIDDVVMELGVLVPLVTDYSLHLRGNAFEGLGYANIEIADWTGFTGDAEWECEVTLTGVSDDPAPTTNLHFSRLGKHVTVRIPQIVGDADSATLALDPTVSIPTNFLPVRDVSALIPVYDDATLQVGSITLGADGSLALGADGDGGDFAGTAGVGTSGVRNLTTMTYEAAS